MQRNQVLSRPRIALALTSCAVALAACGGSGSKPNASAGPYGPANSPATLSQCMRANRVSGFPDPSRCTRRRRGAAPDDQPGRLLDSRR